MQQQKFNCPELFSDLLKVISDVENSQTLADALRFLPYMKSITETDTVKNTETEIQTEIETETDVQKEIQTMTDNNTVMNDEQIPVTDKIDHLSELLGFINYIGSNGNLRENLVLMKFLFSVLEYPERFNSVFSQLLVENNTTVIAEQNNEKKDSLSSDVLIGKNISSEMLSKLEKVNLIGKNDIIELIDLMNEKSRLANFDCYPRLLIETGLPEKLRAFEVRGAVTGFVGGVFIQPNTGYSYFEVTLKGCNVGVLGVRVGWGFCYGIVWRLYGFVRV